MAKKKAVKKQPPKKRPTKKQPPRKPAKARAAKKPASKKAASKPKRAKKAAAPKRAKQAVLKKPKPKKKGAKPARQQPAARPALTLEAIKVIGGPLVLSTQQEVDEAQTKLGVQFPTGYREYVTRFGEGVLGGYYVRVYPPRRILSGSNNLQEWRDRIGQYWFWDEGRDVLTKQQSLESVIIGDTLDGDELIVHPSRPDRVYVLPRQSEKILVAGEGLLPALDWLCSAGALTEPFPEREFEPFDSRKAE